MNRTISKQLAIWWHVQCHVVPEMIQIGSRENTRTTKPIHLARIEVMFIFFLKTEPFNLFCIKCHVSYCTCTHYNWEENYCLNCNWNNLLLHYI